MQIIAELKNLAARIGYESIVFITLAMALAQVAGTMPDAAPYKGVLFAAAAILAAVGVLVGLLRFLSPFFRKRPARGFIDGLAAGLLAGAFGGFFGYGWHASPSYLDPPLTRIVLCTLFALPLGGVLGLCFDLVHPDRRVPWQEYLGGILLSVTLTFFVSGFSVVYFAPAMKGAGIKVADLQLLFECFLVLITLMAGFSFRWPAFRYAMAVAVAAGSIAVLRIITTSIPYQSTCQPAHVLADMQYLVEIPGCRERPEWLGFSVVLLMVWAYVTYAFAFKLPGWLKPRLEPPLVDVHDVAPGAR